MQTVKYYPFFSLSSKRLALIFSFWLWNVAPTSGQEWSSPFLDVFPKEVYGYGVPNWNIQQSQTGLIYAANNEGLLEYDGYQWKLFPLPNRTIVRDILLRGDSIFAGGQNEVGYFKRNPQEKWKFISIRNAIPETHRQFEDVWDMLAIENKLCFRSSNKIFLFENGHCQVLDEEEYLYLGQLKETLLLHSKSGKLIQKKGDQNTLLLESDLLKTILIRSVITSETDTLIATHKKGIWVLKNGALQKWQAKDAEIRALTFLNKLQVFPDGTLGISTNFNGFYHVDRHGTVLHHLSKENGLPSSGVIAAFRDYQQNLWLGLENGLGLLHLHKPIREIDLTKGDFGPAYDLTIHKDQIYLGTNQGLFRTPLSAGFTAESLTLIDGTQGQVWGLDVIGDRLFMSHNDGLFLIEDNQALPLFTDFGSWLVQPYQNSKDTLLVGSYQGIHLLDIRQPTQRYTISGLQESSRFLVQDQRGDTWMSHPYRGVFRISHISQAKEQVTFYDEQKGLPSTQSNHVFLIGGVVMVAASHSVFRYAPEEDRFIPSTTLNHYLDTHQKIRRLKEVENGDIWFISNTEVGYLKKTSKGLEQHYEKFRLPHLKRFMNNGWEKIFDPDGLGILLTSINGLLHYQEEKDTTTDYTYPVLLESLLINNDSMIYPSFHSSKQYTFAPRQNTLAFRVAAIDYTDNRSTLYQYKLKGWDKEWTPLTEKRVKEYTDLPYRKFVLQVRAQTPGGSSYPPFSFPFVIRKPWYLTTLALTSYALLGLFLLSSIFYFVSRRFSTLKQEFSTSVKKSKEEIRQLENIRIQAELDHKKRELVSTTIHITKQNETINALQQMLSGLKKEVKEHQTSHKVNKILNYLKQERRADKNWDQLLYHFNELHPSFFDRLKKEHPELRPKDMKLCAYLKINLTTKEMASLMNISVRGIEASRYRLRKRLGIDSNVDLNEYFMNY